MVFLSIVLIAFSIIAFQRCKQDAKGNEVTIGLIGEPDGLNPISNISQGYSRQVMERHIFAFLADADPNTSQTVPFLAKGDVVISAIDTGILKGGTAYTYEILDEAKWDNGQPVTGHDAVFSIKAILNPKVNGAVWRGYMEFIKDIKVDANNPKKLTFLTNKKYILAKEAIENIPFLPAYHYDPKGLMKDFSIADLGDKAKLATLVNDPKINEFAQEFNTKFGRDKDKIVGCGAYQLEAWENGQRLILKKKDNWWGNALMDSRVALAAYSERLIYKFYNNTQSQITDLKAGNLDVMATIPAPDFKKLQADSKFSSEYNLIPQPALTNSILMLNVRNPKLNDKKVRQAMAHAIDVDQIIKNVIEGLAIRMNTVVLPTKDYNRKDLPPIPYNVEKAKQLLAESGWKDSNNNGTVDKMIGGKLTELNVSYLTANKAPNPDIAILVQNNLKAIGIGVEIITKDFNIVKDEQKKGNFDISFSASGGLSGLDDFEQKWHSKKGSNETGFGNPKLDALIDQINSTLDAAPRNELYGQFQQIIYDEQPVIVLMNSKERLAISKRFASAKPSLARPYFFEQTFKVK